jgi:PBP1b-binding outer membrane lipoprotein LpoB
MMRKSMFAALLVLIMMLGGCSDVSTAPHEMMKTSL